MKIRSKSETLVGPLVGDVIHEDDKESAQLTDDAFVENTSDDILKLGEREDPIVMRPSGLPTDAPQPDIKVKAGKIISSPYFSFTRDKPVKILKY